MLMLANYFLMEWFFGLHDKYYIDSFSVCLSIVVGFAGAGNMALAARDTESESRDPPFG